MVDCVHQSVCRAAERPLSDPPPIFHSCLRPPNFHPLPQIPRIITLYGAVSGWLETGVTVEVVGWWLKVIGVAKPGAWLLAISDDEELHLVANLVTRLPFGVNVIAGVSDVTTVPELQARAQELTLGAKQLSTLPAINWGQALPSHYHPPTHRLRCFRNHPLHQTYSHHLFTPVLLPPPMLASQLTTLPSLSGSRLFIP